MSDLTGHLWIDLAAYTVTGLAAFALIIAVTWGDQR